MDFTSQGSFGLSHFRTSRAAQENYEPVYLNLFTVQIQLPTGVGATPESTNLMLENVQNIGGLKSHKFPASPVAQYYKWAARRFAGAKPSETTMDLTLDFEVTLIELQVLIHLRHFVNGVTWFMILLQDEQASKLIMLLRGY